MTDFQSRHTGNSRFLKSAIPSGTSWEDALQMLIDGTFPIDLNGINPAGVVDAGTPYNKACVLTDKTAENYGIYSIYNPTVNDIFERIITPGNTHVYPVGGFYSSAGERIGTRATSEGYETLALTDEAHAEGNGTVCDKARGHAEGVTTICAQPYAVFKMRHVYPEEANKFYFDTTYGNYSDAFSKLKVGDKLLISNTFYIDNVFYITVASKGEGYVISKESNVKPNDGDYAVNISYISYDSTLGNIYPSHAEGFRTVSTGANSHAEGYTSSAFGAASHSEGGQTKANSDSSHAEGMSTVANGRYSHAEGHLSNANGEASHAEGRYCVANGNYSHAGGASTTAEAYAQTVIGEYNKTSDNTADRFIIGKGSRTAANAFRVNDNGVYGATYSTNGADYAEMFEWKDGNKSNEDRAGLFVTLDGDKIKIANSYDDFILGIVSGNPSVVGDEYGDQWSGMYETDVFGRPIFEDIDIPEKTETVTIPITKADGEKGLKPQTETRIISPARKIHTQKVRSEYNETQPYKKRRDRPEWDAVGMLGKLIAIDNGTCKVNGWAKVGENGIAIHSDERTHYRVMKRIDNSHIQILII